MLFSYLFRLLTRNVLSICRIYLFDKLPRLPYVYPLEITAVRGTTVLNRESIPAPCFICVTSAIKSLGVKAADCIRALVQRREAGGGNGQNLGLDSGHVAFPSLPHNTTKMVRCRFNDLSLSCCSVKGLKSDISYAHFNSMWAQCILFQSSFIEMNLQNLYK